MSRCYGEVVSGERIDFGWDHALGYFLQRRTIDPETGEEKITLDRDSKFHKLSKSELVEYLHENLSENDLKKFEKQITKIALDLTF